MIAKAKFGLMGFVLACLALPAVAAVAAVAAVEPSGAAGLPDFPASQRGIVIPEGADPTQQYKTGLRYFNGEGVPQDYSTAFTWIRRAAEQGLPEAQSTLGVLYEKGYGVVRNE